MQELVSSWSPREKQHILRQLMEKSLWFMPKSNRAALVSLPKLVRCKWCKTPVVCVIRQWKAPAVLCQPDEARYLLASIISNVACTQPGVEGPMLDVLFLFKIPNQTLIDRLQKPGYIRKFTRMRFCFYLTNKSIGVYFSFTDLVTCKKNKLCFVES